MIDFSIKTTLALLLALPACGTARPAATPSASAPDLPAAAGAGRAVPQAGRANSSDKVNFAETPIINGKESS